MKNKIKNCRKILPFYYIFLRYAADFAFQRTHFLQRCFLRDSVQQFSDRVLECPCRDAGKSFVGIMKSMQSFSNGV